MIKDTAAFTCECFGKKCFKFFLNLHVSFIFGMMLKLLVINIITVQINLFTNFQAKIWLFLLFLSVFSFTTIHESQDYRGRERVFL